MEIKNNIRALSQEALLLTRMNFYLKVGEEGKLWLMLMDDLKISSHNMTKQIKLKEEREASYRHNSQLKYPDFIQKIINSKKVALRYCPISNQNNDNFTKCKTCLQISPLCLFRKIMIQNLITYAEPEMIQFPDNEMANLKLQRQMKNYEHDPEREE